MKFTTQNLLGATAALAICGTASAGLVDWQAAADADGAAFSEINVTSGTPVSRDIGLYDETTGGGITYEFVVNGTTDGASNALLGTATLDGRDRGGIKFSQFNNTGQLGVTQFGVADFNSLVAAPQGVDTVLTFVNNGTDTLVYVDGVLQATMTGANLEIEGLVGVGGILNDDTTTFDNFTGNVLGVAVYDSALTAQEIADHNAAFVPEPGSLALLGLGGLALLRRRRG